MDHPGSVTTIPLDDGNAVRIGPLRAEHVDDLWMMFTDAVARGEGYPQTPPLTRETFEQTWTRPVTVTVGAVLAGELVGAYYLKPNQPGLGAHIANAGYLVSRRVRGGGIGRMLVADSIERAPLAGFDAVQFNFVFESNPARAMYEDLGWREIGRVPEAVPAPGGTARQAAIIYWRPVGPPARPDDPTVASAAVTARPAVTGVATSATGPSVPAPPATAPPVAPPPVAAPPVAAPRILSPPSTAPPAPVTADPAHEAPVVAPLVHLLPGVAASDPPPAAETPVGMPLVDTPAGVMSAGGMPAVVAPGEASPVEGPPAEAAPAGAVAGPATAVDDHRVPHAPAAGDLPSTNGSGRARSHGRTPPHAGHRSGPAAIRWSADTSPPAEPRRWPPAPAVQATAGSGGRPDPARLREDVDRIMRARDEDEMRRTIDVVLRSYTDGHVLSADPGE